jgi:ATP-dependent protease ClpP protease subunit
MENKHKVNFVSNNTVYIHGEFNESMVELLPQIQTIIDSQKKLKEGKIIFDINSIGGSGQILMSFINLIEKAKKEGVIVETIVQCKGSSCGSMLACSGTVGHRYISEYAEHLCHFGSGWSKWASPTQIERGAEYALRWQNNAKAMYKKYCEPTAQEGYITKLFENMKDDCFYVPAEECIKYGLADKIL